jgi:hypothetical protein
VDSCPFAGARGNDKDAPRAEVVAASAVTITYRTHSRLELRMVVKFSEQEVHNFIFEQGLEALIDDCPEFEPSDHKSSADEEFALWRIIKARAMAKLRRIHKNVRYGKLIGSKIKLPTDKTTPMELDMLGQHNDGPVVLELKVEKSAERNTFSELLAYSNYLSEMFALAGSKDITNVLIAKVEAKITRSAFLYDLLIADRNTIVYKPVTGELLSSLRLQLHLPSDDDFRYFTNQLLAHDSVACVVASFHDVPGWFDSEEKDGNLNDYTREHLSALSGYTAPLMEAERLNGFCFIRKRWKELEFYYENSLIVCAINPFRLADVDRAVEIYSQLSEDRDSFFETVAFSFAGRIIDVARRAIEDCLTHDCDLEIELPSGAQW